MLTTSIQDEFHAIFFLAPSLHVLANDLKEPVKNCSPFSFPGIVEILLDTFAVAWVTLLQSQFELPYGLGITQPLARQRSVLPTEDKSSLGRSEPTPENIVECVQVMPPVTAWNEYPIYLVKEALKRVLKRDPSIS